MAHRSITSGVLFLLLAAVPVCAQSQPPRFTIIDLTELIPERRLPEHVHFVWRDFENDFGVDLLRRHYDESGPDHGHDH